MALQSYHKSVARSLFLDFRRLRMELLVVLTRGWRWLPLDALRRTSASFLRLSVSDLPL